MNCCVAVPSESTLQRQKAKGEALKESRRLEEPQTQSTIVRNVRKKEVYRRSSGQGLAKSASMDGKLEGATSAASAMGPFAQYIGVSAVKNARPYMEDYFDIAFHAERKVECVHEETVHYFGVFDGHGGFKTSRYLSKELVESVVKQPAFVEGKLGEAVELGFAVTDADLRAMAKTRGGPDDGSCCCSVWLHGEHLMVANVGDSRAVMSSGGTAVALSNDHKPNRPDERRRIQSHGGFVQVLGVPRVNGVLAVSRAFGDSSLKPYITSAPEIAEVELGAIGEDEFIIVASDGLWDVFGNQDAVDFCHKIYKKQKSWEAAAKGLTELAMQKGSGDNITVIVVSLDFRKVTGA